MADKITARTDQRSFTIVYDDFLESSLLTEEEKMLFIYLKRYADNRTLQSFPGIKTLAKLQNCSYKTVQRRLKRLEQLGVIKIEPRPLPSGGRTSNLYTLYDYRSVWQNKESETVDNAVAEEQRSIDYLRSRGYTITKEKEPASQTTGQSSADVSPDPSFNYNSSDAENTQVSRFTLNDLKVLYKLDEVEAATVSDDDIIAILTVILDVMNTDKKKLRVSGGIVPAEEVRQRLLQLSGQDIVDVLKRYMQQGRKIKNYKGYVLTMLYNAKIDNPLEITNQVGVDRSES